MRRRRQKNTLLVRMIGVAVLINAILLPILAQFGVFHRIRGGRLTQVSLVKLPPPEKNPAEKQHHVAKPAPKRQPIHQVSAHAYSTRPLPPNPNQPKVVAASSGDNENGGATIANNGTAPPGQVVTPQARQETAPASSPAAPKPAPAPTPAPPVSVAPPARPAPALVHQPVVVAARPVVKPEPTIPSDLLSDDLETTFLALFNIKADGTASVTTLKSTGNQTLDRLALDTARKWTFRPATRDGQPVDSYLKLQIEFQVSD